MGDSKINLLNPNNDELSWVEMLENFQTKQLVTERTRVTNKTSTLIDHMYVTDPDKIRAVKVPKIAMSDHLPTCLVHHSGFGTKHSHTTIKYRSYKGIDIDSFLADLEAVPWSVIDIFDNVNDALETWYVIFLDVVNVHAPLTEKRVKKAKQPDWFNDEVVQAMSQRDHFKYIKDENMYKHLRNKCV